MDWKNETKIEFSVAEIWKMMEAIVPLHVSLASLGSYYADDREGEAKAVNQFTYEFEMFQRLGKVRRALDERLEAALTESQRQQLEDEGEDWPYWSPQ